MDQIGQIELTRKVPKAFGDKVSASSLQRSQLLVPNETDLSGSSSTLSASTTTLATTTSKTTTPSLASESVVAEVEDEEYDLASELEITTAKFESGKIDTTNLPGEDFGEDSLTALPADLGDWEEENEEDAVDAENENDQAERDSSTSSR